MYKKGAFTWKGGEGNEHQRNQQKICSFYIFFLQLGKESNAIISVRGQLTILKKRNI